VTRVLLVFEPPDGGVAEHVRVLATTLGAYGVQVEVAGPPDSIAYASVEAAGVRVHRLPFARTPRFSPGDVRALQALRRLARSGRFELVHCHSSKAGLLGRAAARSAGVATAYSPHCFGFVGDVSRARALPTMLAERWLGHNTDLVVCACEAEHRRATVDAGVSEDRARVIRYGARGPEPGTVLDPRLVALRGSGVLAGAVSVLRHQKRLDLLLEAAPRVLSAVPDARLAIVGDGPERDALRARADQLGLSGDKRFALLPFLGPSARHLLALDVYVLPSAWEAMPIGALEALACGIPQVATAVEGTPEAVDHGITGELVGPGDPAALAEALIGLLSDPGRRRSMAEASRRRFDERFRIDRMVEETVAAYRDIVRAA